MILSVPTPVLAGAALILRCSSKRVFLSFRCNAFSSWLFHFVQHGSSNAATEFAPSPCYSGSKWYSSRALSALRVLIMPVELPMLTSAGKQTATVSLAYLQLALLVLWSTTSDNQIRRTRASVPTAALSFVVSLGVCLLSFLEHMRSVRPSLIIDIWLFLSILFDVVRARTLWLLQESRPISILQTCTIAVRCCMVVLESTGKRSILLAPYKDYPLESLSGTFCRSIFFWLNSLIAVGYSKILTLNDLATLDEELDAARLHAKFQVAWDKGSRSIFIINQICSTLTWTTCS